MLLFRTVDHLFVYTFFFLFILFIYKNTHIYIMKNQSVSILKKNEDNNYNEIPYPYAFCKYTKWYNISKLYKEPVPILQKKTHKHYVEIVYFTKCDIFVENLHAQRIMHAQKRVKTRITCNFYLHFFQFVISNTVTFFLLQKTMHVFLHTTFP